MTKRLSALALAFLMVSSGQSWAQFTVLGESEPTKSPEAASEDIQPDLVEPEPEAVPACGTQPLTLARMSWPSASLLAEIHAIILRQAYQCQVQIVPSEPAAAVSTMGSTGSPSIVPELWVSRIPDLWNGAMDAQTVRSAGPSYDSETFEGWFMPSQTAGLFTQGPALSNLAEAIPQLSPNGKLPFISCPADWACAVINRNLIKALALDDLLEMVEPRNRFEMDQLIAEAVNKREPFLFYYWQPNPVLAQLEFTPVQMGAYEEEAFKCLAANSCVDPKPSAFAAETVVVAMTEKLVSSAPFVAGYLQRARMPLTEMDRLLAELSLPGATETGVAQAFVDERDVIWRVWVGEAFSTSAP